MIRIEENVQFSKMYVRLPCLIVCSILRGGQTCAHSAGIHAHTPCTPSQHNPGPVNNELFYYVHVGCNDNHILQVLRLIPRPRPLTSDNARMFELYPGSQPRAPVSLSKQLPNIIKDNHLCSNNLQNYDRPE